MRLLMERKIVASVSIYVLHALMLADAFPPKNPHISGVPQSNIHLDILMGRDETIEPVDIFGGEILFLSIIHSLTSYRDGDWTANRPPQRDGKILPYVVYVQILSTPLSAH